MQSPTIAGASEPRVRIKRIRVMLAVLAGSVRETNCPAAANRIEFICRYNNLVVFHSTENKCS